MNKLWNQNPVVFARSNANDDILVDLNDSRKVDQYPDKYPYCEIFENETEALLWLKSEMKNMAYSSIFKR